MDVNDKRIGILMLLTKLNTLGIRKVTYHWNNPSPPPPCSISLAIVTLSREFVQWVPKRKYPNEFWVVQ